MSVSLVQNLVSFPAFYDGFISGISCQMGFSTLESCPLVKEESGDAEITIVELEVRHEDLPLVSCNDPSRMEEVIRLEVKMLGAFKVDDGFKDK